MKLWLRLGLHMSGHRPITSGGCTCGLLSLVGCNVRLDLLQHG